MNNYINSKGIIISPKILAQLNDLVIKEYVSFCDIYWIQEQNVNPSFELHLLEIISHENLEVSSQELRILINSHETTTLITNNNNNNNNSNNSNNHGNNGNNNNENKSIVLYLGMSNGIIQKHKLKLVNL